MGWYYTLGSSLKSIIQELCEGWEKTDANGRTVKLETIAHCFRGAVTHKGVLWSVGQRTITEPDGTVKVDKWIRCDLLHRQNGYGWGHKPMEESMGPCYYNCPEKYLKMTEKFTDCHCQEWRDGVNEYHSRRRAKLAEKRKQKGNLAYA